ncbi:MAG: DUF2164 domain-containing protein [Planctomycetes bacterium]|nr:DUF2164 domain-containing protein [Planctomycetota bacterium]
MRPGSLHGHSILLAIRFSEEQRNRIRQALAGYVREHFDHEMGDLQSEVFLDFVVGLVGASAYNQAVTDAQAWLQGKLGDLGGDVHEVVEFEWEGKP